MHTKLLTGEIINLHESYKLNQRNIAELVAFLKNSVIYEDNGKLYIVDTENINERINQLLSEKKFIGANELINSAKNGFQKEKIVSAEIVSKSIRLPFPSFYKFSVIAENGEMSLSDVMRKITVPKLKSSLKKIEQFQNVENEKLRKIMDILEEWEAKKNTKYYSINSEIYIGKGRQYVGDLSNVITPEIDILFMKYLQLLVSNVLTEYKLPIEIAQLYAESYIKKTTWIKNESENFTHYNPFISTFEAIFTFVKDHLKIGLSAEYRDVDTADILDEFADNEIINKFGEEIAEKFFDFLGETGIELGDFSLGNYDIIMSGKNILINGINPLDKASLQKIVYDELNYECVFSSYSEDYEKNPLINSNFNEENCNSQLQLAISQGDYETASKYSEVLQNHQILSDLSSSICDILNKIIRDSRVVTFTIPRTIMTLLDLTREDNSLRTFIENDLNIYWDVLEETEVK